MKVRRATTVWRRHAARARVWRWEGVVSEAGRDGEVGMGARLTEALTAKSMVVIEECVGG